MEHILESIAHRVVTMNLNEQALRRVYCVELRRKTKLTKFESTITGNGWSDASTRATPLWVVAHRACQECWMS